MDNLILYRMDFSRSLKNFVVIVFFVLTSCNNVHNEEDKVLAKVTVFEEADNLFLQVKIVNNLGKPIFLPGIARFPMDSISILNTCGENLNRKIFYNEGEVRSMSLTECNTCAKIEVEKSSEPFALYDLYRYRPPFSQSKKLSNSLIWEEYYTLMGEVGSLNALNYEDISIIIGFIESKYVGTVFLNPGQAFTWVTCMNALKNYDKEARIFLNYTYPNIEENMEQLYVFNNLHDSIYLPDRYLRKFEEYYLYDLGLFSDTVF